MTTPQWNTAAGRLLTLSGNVTTSTRVSATGVNTVYTKISGELPQGLVLSSTGTIAGITTANIKNIESRFVLRATDTETNILADRTFSITVLGSAAPVWSTVPFILGKGYTIHGYFLENEFIELKLSAHAPENSPVIYPIKYSLSPSSPALPLGISLTNGTLSGILKTDVNPGEIKQYNFIFEASDGFASSTQTFRMSVITADSFRADSTLLALGTATSSLVDLTLPGTVALSSLQFPQFLGSGDLGTVYYDDNQYIPITVYNPVPLLGPVSYELIPGQGMLNNLPQGLSLDSTTGYINGFIPYQAIYTNTYHLNIKATKTGTKSSASASDTLTLTIKGQVDSDIAWISGEDLGSIESGTISELTVLAKHTNSDYSIKYRLASGKLPPGMEINRAGNIQGRSNQAGAYVFEIEAGDIYNFGAVNKTFKLTVAPANKTYTEIYAEPMMSMPKRMAYQEFINNEFTFDPDLIYRYYDPNFGIQHNPRMIIEFGIEKLNLEQYLPALSQNFYRRRFNFGDIKVAVSKNIHGTVIYEAVYVDIVDNLINSLDNSIGPAITANGVTYYPASITNMRKRLESITVGGNKISVDEYQNPGFMRTAQAGNYKPPGYLHILPICYALPGQGNRIVSRIKLSGFDFKLLDFEVDRLILQNQENKMLDKYLILDKDSISDSPGQ